MYAVTEFTTFMALKEVANKVESTTGPKAGPEI